MNTKQTKSMAQVLLIVLLTISLGYTQQSHTAAEAEAIEVNTHNTRSTIDPISISRLGKNTRGARLYITEQEFFDAHGKPLNLRQVLETHHVNPDNFLWMRGDQQQEEEIEVSDLIKKKIATQEPQKNGDITLSDVPQLLSDGCKLAKSFLLTSDEELPSLFDEEKYIQKKGLNRLFTYASIEQIMRSHVHLPQKILVLQDVKTKKYVPNKDALEIIDTILKPFFHADCNGNDRSIKITTSDDVYRYAFIVFAEKITRSNKILSKEAYNELKRVCETAPFDVGYDNIFADDNGDAVIIDTEFWGESSKSCIAKLCRYSHEE